MVDLTGLGRVVSKDERDLAHPIRKLSIPKEVRSKIWSSPGVMDQGATAQCVAYSGTKYLTSGPIVNKPPLPIRTLYRECQKIDEFPGEELDGGTSVRALFKILKKLGTVSEYRWAFDGETVINHLLTRGPVVVGTSWHRDMFTPDRYGYIWPEGEDDGGHAWLIVGAYRDRVNPDKTKGAVRMVNSWGRGWGQNGRAWVTFKSLDILIRNNGEACVATEIIRKK